MFIQNFIKLRAAVHELSCPQETKIRDDTENNIAFASAGSKILITVKKHIMIH